MVEALSSLVPSGSVSVLLHPSTVPVIDVFRSLSALEDQYDLAVLDEPERALVSYARPELAKAIISDALLLAFALTRQRGQPLCHRALKSRHGSLDEYCLLALIGGSRAPNSELTRAAAAALEIDSLDSISALVRELARQIDLGCLVLTLPSLPEFHAVVGDRLMNENSVDDLQNRADSHFKF